MFSVRQALRALGVVCSRHTVSSYRSSCNTGMFRRFAHENNVIRIDMNKLEGKMRLMFTCKKCNTRMNKLISKLAYYKGLVIVRCDGCKNNHLIADNLGWFSEIHKGINIEKLMAEKGETVRKVMNDKDGYYEATLREDADETKSDEHPDQVRMIDASKKS